jgi:hypothetical protein
MEKAEAEKILQITAEASASEVEEACGSEENGT